MKKMLILLAVATLPTAAGCCCTQLCPLCPCNWFTRNPVLAPAPAYAAPLAASPCAPATYVPSPCAPNYAAAPGAVSPLAATVMPQYFAPPAASPFMTQAPAVCCPAPAAAACCMPEPSCAYSSYPVEPGCGGPYMGSVSYGPMECGCAPCGGCEPCGGCSNCSSAAPATVTTGTATPEPFVTPTPGKE